MQAEAKPPRGPAAPIDRNGRPVSFRLTGDGYVNAMMGYGVPGLDRTVSTHFLSGLRTGALADIEVASLYRDRGLAARIVDLPADDCLSRGITVEGDDEEAIAAEFDRLGAIGVLQDAVRWSRLDGAAAVLLIAPGAYTETLPETGPIGRIEEMRAYSVTEIKAQPERYAEASRPNFGEPIYYRITPEGGDAFDVHESRLLRITGNPLPRRGGTPRVPWDGRSALAACATDVKRYDTALGWSERLLERKQQGIYNMLGLAELLENDQDDLARKRVHMVDTVRSILNTVVVDKEDAYTVLNLGLDGVRDTINEMQVALSGATGIPVTVLFGRSPAGQNSTGVSDLEIYYALVGRIQARSLRRPMERLIELLWRQPEMGAEPEDWTLKFNPLWVPSEQEQAQTRKAQAEARGAEVASVVATIDGGLLTEEEGRDYLAREWPELAIEEGSAPPEPEPMPALPPRNVPPLPTDPAAA